MQTPDISGEAARAGTKVGAADEWDVVESDYVFDKFCCEENTQFPARMAHCEDKSHTAASWFGYPSNLDGIVKVVHRDNHYRSAERETRIKDDRDYISDHDGMNLDVNLPNGTPFNIISYNLEGICKREDRPETYIGVIRKYHDHFRPYIRTGTIIALQEVVLQLTDFAQQEVWLDENIRLIQETFHIINPNLVFEVDGFTGAIIWDSAVWRKMRTVEIIRAGSKAPKLKRSNAYLFQHRDTGFHFWLVNIHLKAPSPIAKQATINRLHNRELRKIITTIQRENPRGLPVYFCGDYNDTQDKLAMITRNWD